MLTIRGQGWRRQAVCLLETPDAPELWTPEHRPRSYVRVHLEQMCQRCPVRRECAADAVEAQTSEAGLYAGVWVPELRKKKQWASAMDDLRTIAGLDSTAGDFSALGASA